MFEQHHDGHLEQQQSCPPDDHSSASQRRILQPSTAQPAHDPPARARAPPLIVYADDDDDDQKSHSRAVRSHRGSMDVDYRTEGNAGFGGGHDVSPSHPHGIDSPSQKQSAAAFWPVPRPAQGYPGTVYGDAQASPADYQPGVQLKREAPSDPSYFYDTGNSMLRHPIVYSQPPGQPHHGPWSDAGSSYSEYPTAPYIAQSQGMPHPAESYHGHYSYGSYPDGDNAGKLVSEGAHAGDQYEEGSMWPLAAPHGAMASMYGMPGEGGPMPGSPDKGKSKARAGLPLPLPKQFKCSACDAIFSRNHDLKRHARIHLAVKPFPCGYCDKAFSRKDALKRHVLVKGCGIGSKKGTDARRRGKAKPAKDDFDVASQDSSFESYSVGMAHKNSDDVHTFRNLSPYEHHAGAVWSSAEVGASQQYGVEEFSPHSRQEASTADSEYERGEGFARAPQSRVASNSLAGAYPLGERLAAYGMPAPSSFSDGAGNSIAGSRPESPQSDVKPGLEYYRS